MNTRQLHLIPFLPRSGSKTFTYGLLSTLGEQCPKGCKILKTPELFGNHYEYPFPIFPELAPQWDHLGRGGVSDHLTFLTNCLECAPWVISKIKRLTKDKIDALCPYIAEFTGMDIHLWLLPPRYITDQLLSIHLAHEANNWHNVDAQCDPKAVILDDDYIVQQCMSFKNHYQYTDALIQYCASLPHVHVHYVDLSVGLSHEFEYSAIPYSEYITNYLELDARIKFLAGSVNLTELGIR